MIFVLVFTGALFGLLALCGWAIEVYERRVAKSGRWITSEMIRKILK